jgi:hypothetical protein
MAKPTKDVVLFPPGSDLEDVEMLETIERVFGIKLKTQDLERCETVGDLFGVVLAEVPHTERGQSACLSAIAFYRLRRLIAANYPGSTIRPSTPLFEITGRFGVSRLCRLIAGSGDLETPNTFPGWLALGLFMGAIPAMIEGYSRWGWPGLAAGVLVFLLGLSAMKWFATFPRGIATVGDLARSVAGLNVRQFRPSGEPLRRKEVWDSLDAIAHQHSAWSGRITPETRFFR